MPPIIVWSPALKSTAAWRQMEFSASDTPCGDGCSRRHSPIERRRGGFDGVIILRTVRRLLISMAMFVTGIVVASTPHGGWNDDEVDVRRILLDFRTSVAGVDCDVGGNTSTTDDRCRCFSVGWSNVTSDPVCNWTGVSCGELHSYPNEMSTPPQPVNRSSHLGVSEVPLVSNVVNLSFSNCHLAGVLPASLSQLRTLRHLFLTSNNLAGILPSSWGAMQSLEGLYLSRNQVSGSIPPSWLCLTSLRRLFIMRNRLNGTLPFWGKYAAADWIPEVNQTLADLCDLERNETATYSFTAIRLADNDISGCLPDSWASSNVAAGH